MGFQATHTKLRRALSDVQTDSNVESCSPIYVPVDNADQVRARALVTWRREVLPLFFACSLLSFLLTSGLAAGLAASYLMQRGRARQCPGPFVQQPGEVTPGRHYSAASAEADVWTAGADPFGLKNVSSCFHAMLRVAGEDSPFKEITGVKGHTPPKMYGKVPEKTIWTYWYDPVYCTSSDNCKMPAFIELCAESIRKNKGTFDFHILHLDTARNFVSMMELPLRWKHLQPVQQKESLMNALLARYGGVALDLSMVLLRPLDPLWDELTTHEATFLGYMYRVNGQPWEQPEDTAPWFLMSRRNGIFGTTVRSQVAKFCDAYRFPDFPLGDHTLTPVLGNILSSTFPVCYQDQTVSVRERCPQPTQPWPLDPALATPGTDKKIIISDPRDGPHLPFAHLDAFGMGTWSITNISELSGHPPECGSPSECWKQVVLHRYQAGSLFFVKLFRTGGRLVLQGRKELLGETNTFFYAWLKLAGVHHGRDA